MLPCRGRGTPHVGEWGGGTPHSHLVDLAFFFFFFKPSRGLASEW